MIDVELDDVAGLASRRCDVQGVLDLVNVTWVRRREEVDIEVLTAGTVFPVNDEKSVLNRETALRVGFQMFQTKISNKSKLEM